MFKILFWLPFILLQFISCQTKPPLLKKGPALPSYWPTKSWKKSTPEKQGMDSQKLADMFKILKDEDYKIDNISIIRNGFLVTDYYKYPFKKGDKHIIHSVTKSVLSALIGIAIDKGYIKSVKERVINFFPEKLSFKKGEELKNITLEHLLMMSSGLKTEDNWRYKWKGLTKMRTQDDWVHYLLNLPVEKESGKEFDYSNGVSYLISALLFKATKIKPQDFAQRYLFDPLGISKSDVKWSLDPRGVHIGWGGMHMRPSDMAKFGLLFLNKGVWDGKQVISREWIEESTKTRLKSDLYENYGYQWWNGPAMYKLEKSWRHKWNYTMVKSDPIENYYMAVGFMGQFIYVVPDRNMVIVFTSHLPVEGGQNFIPKALVDEYILPSVVSNSPLKEKKEVLQKLNSSIFEAQKEKAFIWTSKSKGVTQQNLFIRTEEPSLELKFPKGSLKSNLIGDAEIMALTTPEGARLSLSLRDIPEEAPLSKTHLIIKGFLKSAGNQIKLLSNKRITLKDQTPAFKSTFEWKFLKTFNLRTEFISIYKKGKWISLSYAFDSLDLSARESLEEDLDQLIQGLTL